MYHDGWWRPWDVMAWIHAIDWYHCHLSLIHTPSKQTDYQYTSCLLVFLFFLDRYQGYILTTGTLANTNYIAIPINAANKLAAVVSANYLARWTSDSLTDPPPRSIWLDISSHIIPFLFLLFRSITSLSSPAAQFYRFVTLGALQVTDGLPSLSITTDMYPCPPRNYCFIFKSLILLNFTTHTTFNTLHSVLYFTTHSITQRTLFHYTLYYSTRSLYYYPTLTLYFL